MLKNDYIEYIARLSKLDLLILDDFSTMDLNPDMRRNLFELIDAREGRRSIIVISQHPISSWYTLFKDNTYADSCMDMVYKAGISWKEYEKSAALAKRTAIAKRQTDEAELSFRLSGFSSFIYVWNYYYSVYLNVL